MLIWKVPERCLRLQHLDCHREVLRRPRERYPLRVREAGQQRVAWLQMLGTFQLC